MSLDSQRLNHSIGRETLEKEMDNSGVLSSYPLWNLITSESLEATDRVSILKPYSAKSPEKTDRRLEKDFN